MLYKDLLSRYIANSRLTLSQIEQRMRNKGFSTNKAYISKLQNGKLPPAGEDITRALAEVTNGDPEPLIMAGYIEKAPEEVQKLLNGIENTNEFFKKIFLLLVNGNEEILDTVLKETFLDEDNESPIILDTATLIDLFDEFSIESKLHILNFLIEYTQENDLKLEKLLTLPGVTKNNLDDNQEKTLTDKPFSIPVINAVKAGPNGLVYDIPRRNGYAGEEVLGGRKYFWLRINDESMTGDGILPGDLALVRKQPEVEYGDLALVIVDNEEGTLKRVFKKDGSIILQSSNPKYPPQIFTGTECENVHIIGKITETKRNY